MQAGYSNKAQARGSRLVPPAVALRLRWGVTLRCASASIRLDHEQILSGADLPTFFAEQVGYSSADRCVDADFHLHGFNDHHRIALVHDIARPGSYLPDVACNMRGNGAAIWRQIQFSVRAGFGQLINLEL